MERNRNLEAEGAITQDRLDELVKEERNKRATLEQTKARLREAKQQLALLEAGPRRETIAQRGSPFSRGKSRAANGSNRTRTEPASLPQPVARYLSEMLVLGKRQPRPPLYLKLLRMVV